MNTIYVEHVETGQWQSFWIAEKYICITEYCPMEQTDCVVCIVVWKWCGGTDAAAKVTTFIGIAYEMSKRLRNTM